MKERLEVIRKKETDENRKRTDEELGSKRRWKERAAGTRSNRGESWNGPKL